MPENIPPVKTDPAEAAHPPASMASGHAPAPPVPGGAQSTSRLDVETGAPVDPLTAAAVTPEPPGRYRFRAEIGRGGLGRVSTALDTHLGREIAIKELVGQARPGDGDSRHEAARRLTEITDLERFLREARLTGQLEHPNIIPVYEVGRRPDGSLYYTMKRVRGRTLAEALAECHDLRDRLKLLPHYLDLCQAIAYAHSRGVIHRDIKTGNVMLGEFGETVVLDWGIAKVKGQGDDRRLDAPPVWQGEVETGQTCMGTIIGTPTYMSPEQAAGRLDEVDEVSDVWSLGAVLYEILTGGPPFRGATAAAVLSQALVADITPPRGIEPAVPPELAAICEKALQRDRERRHPGAKALADEISAFLAGGRVGSYEYSSWDLLRRFARKNKALLAFSALLLLLIVVSAAALLVSYRKEHAALRSSRYHMAQALDEKADRLNQETKSLLTPVFAAASLLNNPASPASPHFDADFSREVPDSTRLVVEAASKVYQGILSRSLQLKRTVALEHFVTRVGFSPDGRILAIGSTDGRLELRDPETGAPLRSDRLHPDMVLAIAFSPDGALLATAGFDGVIRVRDSRSGALRHTLAGHTAVVRTLHFFDGGRKLASAGDDRVIRTWDLRDGSLAGKYEGHDLGVMSVVVSEDGRRMVSGGRDRTVRLWSVPDRKLLRTLSAHDGVVSGVTFCRGESRLVTCSWDGTVKVWDLAAGRCLRTLPWHQDIITAQSLNGSTLATTSLDKTVHLGDIDTGETLLRIDTFNDGLMNAAFSPSGALLAFPAGARSVGVWSRRGPGAVRKLVGHEGIIIRGSFSPDGTMLATGAFDRTVKIWSTRTGTLRATLTGHTNYVQSVEFSRSGRVLASGGRDETVRLWDVASGREIRSVHVGGSLIDNTVFSPDDHWLAVGNNTAVITLVDLGSSQPARSISGHTGRVSDLAFLPDGRRMLSSSLDGTVRFWEIPSGRELRRIDFNTPLGGIALAPDGSRFAVLDRDGRVMVQDLDAGAHRDLYKETMELTSAVAFSPDGRYLVTGARDRRAAVWSFTDGEMVLRLALEVEARWVGFSPDGRSLAVAAGNSAILCPLDYALLRSIRSNPAHYLQEAEKAAGVTLEGFFPQPAAP
ncbi:MAG: protein kinase [Acidobacteria bacterium]|nr:protein kinase [Acidobacteriota bacterium]